jgi:hypothetical protein
MNKREKELYNAIFEALEKHNVTRLEVIHLLADLNEPSIHNLLFAYEHGQFLFGGD